MDASFIIRKKNNHVELNFSVGRQRYLLEWIPFPNTLLARAFIRKIKRYRDEKYLGVLKIDGCYYFEVCTARIIRLCISHKYSSAQRARDGGILFLESMKGADIIQY